MLAILIGGGIAIYGLFLSLFGVTGWREVVRAVKPPAAGGLRG